MRWLQGRFRVWVGAGVDVWEPVVQCSMVCTTHTLLCGAYVRCSICVSICAGVFP